MPFGNLSRRGDENSEDTHVDERASFVATPEVAIEQSRASWEAREQHREMLRSRDTSQDAESRNGVNSKARTQPSAVAAERRLRGLSYERPYVYFPEHELEGAYIEKRFRTEGDLNGTYFRGQLVRRHKPRGGSAGRGDWEVSLI